jgi:hypothetical protein
LQRGAEIETVFTEDDNDLFATFDVNQYRTSQNKYLKERLNEFQENFKIVTKKVEVETKL